MCNNLPIGKYFNNESEKVNYFTVGKMFKIFVLYYYHYYDIMF